MFNLLRFDHCNLPTVIPGPINLVGHTEGGSGQSSKRLVTRLKVIDNLQKIASSEGPRKDSEAEALTYIAGKQVGGQLPPR